jgi:uncharacterized protein (DUF1499 family)
MVKGAHGATPVIEVRTPSRISSPADLAVSRHRAGKFG